MNFKIGDWGVMEQAIMFEGFDELFILGSFNLTNVSCENGVLKDAEKKVEAEISFSQVSHIESITNGLKFFFAVWANSEFFAGKTSNMKVILNEGTKKVTKNANCALKAGVPASEKEV